MMEVKHSPAATQMEFRSSRNGLSENVEDELETLFDEGDSKSLTLKTDKCDEKLPILNGISKHPEESSPAKTLNGIDAELDAKEVQEDAELYDLDLEPECAGETQNGENTDSSKVRDTGDDLDTLLSKINDLVEDCMDKPKTSVESTAKTVDVDIAGDDLNNAQSAKKLISEVKTTENKPEDKCEGQTEGDVNDGEKESPTIDSTKSGSDKMEVDDIVFCLDSPMDETSVAKEKVVEKEAPSEPVEEEVKSSKEEEPSGLSTQAVAESEQSNAPQEEEDDVFLIEDDDDDEATLETESAEAEKVTTNEIEEKQSGGDQDLVQNIEKNISEKADGKSKDDTCAAGHEEDDDIVCLDDSLEEIDKNGKEKIENQEAAAAEEKRKDVVEQEVDKIHGTVKVSEETVKDSAQEETISNDIPSSEESKQNKEKTTDPKGTEAPISEPKEVIKEVGENASEVNKTPSILEDDDIVVLDDDDDPVEDATLAVSTTTEKTIDPPSNSESCGNITDEAKASKDEKITEEGPPTSEKAIAAESTIISDNSDNARDGVEEKEENNEAKSTPEQESVSTESNSASDSLLKEAKTDDPTDIEENNEQPPTKKIRLSQDESNSRLSIISQEETKSNTQDNDNDEPMEDIKTLKRVRSTESLSADFKKPKTDADLDKADDSNSKDTKEEIPKIETKTLPLYPPPKLDPPTIDLSLDFLKRFKKTIHKMTKSDLEELVLQKIVEAIVHKSEFSEMRELIEKQDKIIAGHRTKITELNKQFRDLEMVHNRVLKDLETKNAQFVMPVKITRAVGLQVFFPAKKFDPTLAPLTPQNPAVPPAHSSRSTSNSTAHSTDRSSRSSPVPSSSHTPKPSVSTATSIQAASSSSVQQQASTQRRGCVQKLTPLRPDTPRNSPLNRSVSTGVVSSSTPSPSTSKDQSPAFASRATGQKARVSNTAMTVNTSPKVPVTVVQSSSTPEQPEKHKSAPTTPYAAPNKFGENRGTRTYTKFVTSDPHIISQPLPAAATIVSPAIPPGTTISPIDTSNSGQKSVIDLTDEDDVVPPAPAYSSKTPAPPLAQVSTPPQTSVTVSGNRPYKVSVVPQQQLQQPRPNPPKQIQQRAAVPPKPNGVAIRQVTAPPTRYRHPAPLPNQPAHSSNPAWKLPPARPTIRISNLESGIVISWTIEDTAKDKYAESTSYQIYAYQETSGPPLVESWRHVGDVKAMLLPMAVTLTQFQEGQRYYFAVRAVDAHNRCGPFSFAKTWS